MQNDDTPPPPTTFQSPSPPLAQAALCLEKCNRPFAEHLGAADLLAELERTLDAGGDSEAMLFTQARVLDALFKRIVLRDMHSSYTYNDGTPTLHEECVDLALRAQRQSRCAIEALTFLKSRQKPSAS